MRGPERVAELLLETLRYGQRDASKPNWLTVVVD
jgi:hypothetical protein